MIGGDRQTQNTMDSESKKKSRSRVGWWVGWSEEILEPSLEHSLDSESKFEPSVAKRANNIYIFAVYGNIR